MLATSSKKFIICLVSILLIVTCSSCKADDPYLVKDYLNYLAIKSGIGDSDNIDDNFLLLQDWKIVKEEDYKLLDTKLNNNFLYKTILALLDGEDNDLNLSRNDMYVSKKEAIDIVDNAVSIINNKKFATHFDYDYKKQPVKKSDAKEGDIFFDEEDQTFKVVTNEDEYRIAEFDEVYDYYSLADSFEIDFSNSEIIPLQEEIQSSYKNNKFNLLASKNHVFNSNGFRISYTLSTSGIDVHVSKKIDKTTVYADASINSVKPTFKWTYKDGDLSNCYFNLKMNTTNSLGATIGKYGNYYLKFKDLDSSSFASTIKSMIVPKDDEIEATIPICEIKTPIPNAPFAYINMTLGIKLYVSGKAELILYNSHNIGFEIKDGKSRFFYEHNDDYDTIVRASSKAALALNVGLDATSFRLCDIELDGGIKAEVKSTLHLFDSDFNDKVISSDIPYSTLEDISKDNPYVKACGDLSMYWMCDLIVNTSKSKLNKMGFTKTFHILDDDNQVFGNLHHIENGQFVEKCTRKSKPVITSNSLDINVSNKIVLNSYAEVLLEGQTFNIEVISLPSDYEKSDIRYSSSNSDVVSVKDGVIKANKTGSSKIKVYTSDNKYNSYINILVSTG